MYDFRRGDHLVTPRSGYTHHGIYLGTGWVIHYAGSTSSGGSGDIEVCSLDNFCDGHPCTFRRHSKRKFDREASVRRAFGRLGERRYSVLFNNCEAFVQWCIQGEASSQQVRQGVAMAGMLLSLLSGWK